MDYEIDRIVAAYAALKPLDPEARMRAVAYLASRLGQDPTKSRPGHAKNATEDFITSLSKVSGISAERLLGRERTKAVCQARYAGMALLRDEGISMPDIAKMFGGRDHTTVLNGLKQAKRLTRISRPFQELQSNLAQRIEARSDETAQQVQPKGREPDPEGDAPGEPS